MNELRVSFSDDKRLLSSHECLWVERTSERDWHYCRYCYHDVPTFLLAEGEYGSAEPLQVLRCCWECGSGLEVLTDRLLELTTTREGDDSEETQ